MTPSKILTVRMLLRKVACGITISKLLALAGPLMSTHVDFTHDRLAQRTGYFAIIKLPVLPYSHTQKFLILNLIRPFVLLKMLLSRRDKSSMMTSTSITHHQHVREARWLFYFFAPATYEVRLTSHIYYHTRGIPLSQPYSSLSWLCM